ncbi:MAG: glyoxalase [Acidimicrobiia bacterium]
MDIEFVAGFSAIVSDRDEAKRFYVDTLGLPLEGEQYLMSGDVGGAKHLGAWRLEDAANACFGTPDWPDGCPVPQATIEFEVTDVAAATDELTDAGYDLVHGAREEPWGQTVARLQTPDGLLVGLSRTPWLHE